MNWRVIERPDRDRLGEGLHWSAPEDAVYWTDILGERFHRLTLSSGRVETWHVGSMIGWVIARRGGGLLAGLHRGPALLDLNPLTVTPLNALDEHPPANRMNDAVADAHGRVWAGTMPVTADAPSGGLYRIDPDGRATLVDRDYIIANGPAISPDGRTLYHTDSARRVVHRYALAPDGTLGPREPFIRFTGDMGYPDGMTTDAEGHLWIACWGASCVRRFTPDGALDRTVELPASQITNVCFAGANLDRMFVTSAYDGLDSSAEPLAGALFELDPGVRGLPCHAFAG